MRILSFLGRLFARPRTDAGGGARAAKAVKPAAVLVLGSLREHAELAAWAAARGRLAVQAFLCDLAQTAYPCEVAVPPALVDELDETLRGWQEMLTACWQLSQCAIVRR